MVPAVLLAMGIGSYFVYKQAYRIKVQQGNVFENIAAPGVHGDTLPLYGIRNKMVLVQFWASWCSPCIREIPHLKEVYGKYNKQTFRNADGFEIYAFSLDFDSVKWKNALVALDVPWPYNVNERLAFKSPTAQRLGVTSIPTNVLIDPEHNIVGVDLDPEDLEETLERFKK